MKYIIGILIGVSLVSAGVVYAKSGMEVVGEIKPVSHLKLVKIYDNDNGVVCYLYQGTGVSCVK